MIAARKPTLDDLPSLQRIHQQLCEEEHLACPDQPVDFSFSPEGAEYLRSRLSDPGSFLTVIEATGQIGAFAVGAIDLRSPVWSRLESVYVAPPLRGFGCARTLMEEFLEWSTSKGARHVVAAANKGNSAAVVLYQKAGFKEIDRRGSSLLFQLELTVNQVRKVSNT